MYCLFGLVIPAFSQGAGNALLFHSGTRNMVEIPDHPSLDLGSAFTIEAWIYRTGAGNWQGIVSKSNYSGGYTNTSYVIKLLSTTNGISLWLTSNGGESGRSGTDLGTALTLNEWVHLAVTYSAASGTRIYYNGVLQTSGPHWGFGNPASLYNSSTALRIGTDHQGGDGFPGRIDEVRIWNVVKSEAQIREMMHRRLTGSEMGLSGYWRFDEGSGVMTADATVNANAGTLIGVSTTPPAWITSTAPFGAGVSYTQTVNSTGAVVFTGTNLEINFTAKSGSDVFVVTGINNPPEGTQPTGVGNLEPLYWVARKYGGGTFTANLTFTLNALDPFYQSNPSYVKLFSRASNADGAWTLVGSAASATATTVTFNGISSFSQFAIGYDCPSLLTWYQDADGDLYGNAMVSQAACLQPTGYVADDQDCDDTNGMIYPGALELCNTLDDDCDGQVDNLLTYTTTQGGSYVDPATWGGCPPPNPIPPGMTVNITFGLSNPAGSTIVNNGIINCTGIFTNQGIYKGKGSF
ncbi:MAG: hypothetical protein IPN29_07070 [Saprospiraceae bacterium]|nr:hypothetical protein [Saprospiraceae bacterium]